MNAPADRPPLSQELAEALASRFGSRFSVAASVRLHHGKDESSHMPMPPDAVVFAESTAEVAEIVTLCHRHRTPVIAYGTGTSLEGNVIPHLGGVVVDLAHMDRVLRVSAEDLDVTVQARVTRMQLNEHVRHLGLFFPIDPGANASLGGMAATRASGTNAVVLLGNLNHPEFGFPVIMSAPTILGLANCVEFVEVELIVKREANT